jgi:hypothetical protein
METLIIKIKDKENLPFLFNLLNKLNFISEVQTKPLQKNKPLLKYQEAPIIWAKSKPSINDFTGIWKDRNITLKKLRDKAWNRN